MRKNKVKIGSKAFYQRLKAACAANNTTASQLAVELGIKQGSIFRIATGTSTSRITFPKLVAYVEDYERKLAKQYRKAA